MVLLEASVVQSFVLAARAVFDPKAAIVPCEVDKLRCS